MESLKKDFFKKIIFLFFISWLFGISFLAHPQTSRASDFNKVILMVWDGAQRNHLNQLLTEAKLPNLQALINEGRKRNIEIFTQNCNSTNDGDNYTTATGPGHAAMLTGYGYPTMANHSNGGPNPIPAGYTVFERLKQFNSQIKIGMITGKGLGFFPFPAFENAASSNCCYTNPQGKKQCGKSNSPAINTCQPSNNENQDVGSRFLEFLDNNSNFPFFLFAHLKRPDTDGHGSGENSQEYSNGIINDDQQLGRVIQKLKELGIYDQTVILVTTDHGFNEGAKGHGTCDNYTKNLWIVSNKQRVINKEGVVSKQTSIVPTIFDIFGIDKNVSPPFAGKSLYVSPYIFLSSGWNQITWPDISGYTAKSALEDIDNDCTQGTAVAISRKTKDWWEDFVKNYGGINFDLQNNQNYLIKVSKNCNWNP